MKGSGTITALGSIFLLLLMNTVHASKTLQFIIGIIVPAVLAAIYALLFEHTPIALLLISAAFGNIAILIGVFWILRFLHKRVKWLSITLGIIFFLTMTKVGRLDVFTVTATAMLVISEEVGIIPPFFPKVFVATRRERLAEWKAFLIMNLFILLSFTAAAGFAEHLGASKWVSTLLQIPAWAGLFFVFTSIHAMTSELRSQPLFRKAGSGEPDT